MHVDLVMRDIRQCTCRIERTDSIEAAERPTLLLDSAQSCARRTNSTEEAHQS